jgi:hypothetical protein
MIQCVEWKKQSASGDNDSTFQALEHLEGRNTTSLLRNTFILNHPEIMLHMLSDYLIKWQVCSLE